MLNKSLGKRGEKRLIHHWVRGGQHWALGALGDIGLALFVALPLHSQQDFHSGKELV